MSNKPAGPPLGNQNARKSKPFLAMLNRLLTEDELSKPESKRRLLRAGNQLLNLAAAGEEWAIKELANRLDGKALQGVELSSPNGGAVNFFDVSQLKGMSEDELLQLQSLLQKAGSIL